jgi:hypothetical protein
VKADVKADVKVDEPAPGDSARRVSVLCELLPQAGHGAPGCAVEEAEAAPWSALPARHFLRIRVRLQRLHYDVHEGRRLNRWTPMPEELQVLHRRR